MTATAMQRNVATNGRHRRESAASGLFGRGMVYVLVWSLQLVVSSLVSPVLAHLLPATQFGFLSTSIALFQLFSVLMVFGLDQSLVMEYGDGGVRRASAPRIIFLAAGVATLLTAALVVTGRSWATAAGFTGFHGIVLLCVLWSGPGAVNLVLAALLRAQDRLGAFVAVNLLTSIGGQLGGVVVLLAGARSAEAYGWAGVIVQYLALGVGLLLVRPRARGLFDREWARRVAGHGSSLVAAAVAMFLLNTGDRVLLQRLDGAASVARYQIAYIVGSVPILLLAFLNQAWLPRILEIGDRARQWQVLSRSRDLLMLLVAPAVSALVMIAPDVLRIVAPASYDIDSLEPVVFWVAIAAVPVADCAASTRALVAMRRTKAVTVSTGTAAVLNILLNLVLIPELHVTGAAVATFIAFTVQALVARLQLRRYDTPLHAPALRTLLGVAVFTVLAALGALPFPSTTVWLAGRVVAALALAGCAVVQLVRAESADI